MCGDEYGKPQPHNDGGKWGNKIIAAKYKKGQTIDVTINLTKSHKGKFFS